MVVKIKYLSKIFMLIQVAYLGVVYKSLDSYYYLCKDSAFF